MRHPFWLATVAYLFCTGDGFADENVDPGANGSQYAYAANVGWVNAEPLGDGGPGLELLDSGARGWLWSANVGWISLSCVNTSSCATVNYGVTHDSAGNLAGYAWSPNIGWISFSCDDTNTCGSGQYGVTVDVATGDMTGFAYAANAGWISFSCVSTASCGATDYRVTLDLSELGELIFEDGFESL